MEGLKRTAPAKGDDEERKSEQDEILEIYVKCPSGKTITVEADINDGIEYLKEQIEDQEDILQKD